MAACSGVPILVSINSGISSLMNSMGEGEAVVYNTTGTLQNDSRVWSEKIYQKISGPQGAQIMAQSLRGSLLLDTSRAASHGDFIKIVTGMYVLDLLKQKIRISMLQMKAYKPLIASYLFSLLCKTNTTMNLRLISRLNLRF